MHDRIARALVHELPGLPLRQLEAAVQAALELLDGAATIPFIARYRKERTGGLDEVALRRVDEVRKQLVDLDKRRAAILSTLEADGALTPELAQALAAAATKAELEDLYLPFKKKRKTRASVARERGLGPLADRILAQPRGGPSPRDAARPFVAADRDVPDVDAALAGARDIAAEVVTERADVRALARDAFARHARLTSAAIKKATEGQRTPFEDYYAFADRADRAPSHRVLAIERGEAEGVLKVKLELDDERLVGDVLRLAGHDGRSPFAAELAAAVAEGYKRLLRPSIETEARAALKTRADLDAAQVFARNLEALLLASPLGAEPVLAIDPGFRTGCKCVCLAATGELRAHATIFPHTGQESRAREVLQALYERHRPRAVAIGNGTGGRETEAFARAALGPDALVVAVSEAGASVYSASDVAREEMPDLDLTYRGAVSIGRRLQDPLAELVKVDPKALGVGQYQHDVDQTLLADRLDAVVETAVNKVGVDLNTASPQLLAHVAGIGPALGKAIVHHRHARGNFRSRRELRDVPGLGPARFEQCAGFLRVRGGDHPLDASAVHPERYALVERIAKDLGVALSALVGDAALAARIDPRRWVDADVGLPTLTDIVGELARPGRDPRATFEAPSFRADVQTLEDLEVGMELDGVVTNVTAFGAFVDVGVHQDGLVHVSELADRFVRDPHEVARASQRVRVRVLAVDRERRRISLSARGFGAGTNQTRR